MTAFSAAELIAELNRRGISIAVAESLTGGALAAELISVPGASAVLHGAVVAYHSELKQRLLGVPADLLAERGAVDAEVAEQMADGVRHCCAVAGVPSVLGIATTGVAGPDRQDGHAVGEVYLGLSVGGRLQHRRLSLHGDRATIRVASVAAALSYLAEELGVMAAAEASSPPGEE